MTPNILFAPFGDKVTGTELYHKTLQPDDKAVGTFIFRETTEALAAQRPIRVPPADILKALGGDEGEQHRRQAGRETLGPARVAVPGTSSPGSQSASPMLGSHSLLEAGQWEGAQSNLPCREEPVEGGAGPGSCCSLACRPKAILRNGKSPPN